MIFSSGFIFLKPETYLEIVFLHFKNMYKILNKFQKLKIMYFLKKLYPKYHNIFKNKKWKENI